MLNYLSSRFRTKSLGMLFASKLLDENGCILFFSAVFSSPILSHFFKSSLLQIFFRFTPLKSLFNGIYKIVFLPLSSFATMYRSDPTVFNSSLYLFYINGYLFSNTELKTLFFLSEHEWKCLLFSFLMKNFFSLSTTFLLPLKTLYFYGNFCTTDKETKA